MLPLKISRILHAGYVFESDHRQIIFDPIFENPFSRNCYAYPDVDFDISQISKLAPEAIFISHFHDDHCSLESLQHLDRRTVVYLYCLYEDLFAMLKEIGFLDVRALQIDEGVEVGPFRVTPRRALDVDVDCFFHIEDRGLNILNVVDAWINPSTLPTLAKTSWDLVLWPFQTMREVEVIAPSMALPAEIPPEWKETLKILAPRFIVPSSCQFIHEPWSWYRKAYFPVSYKRFQQEIESYLPTTKVSRLNPGISIELDHKGMKASTPLPWVLPRGNQEVDYNYDENTEPPKTSEISRNFSALSHEKQQRVLNFCKVDLIKKYNAMTANIDGPITKLLTTSWTLVIYDHLGDSQTLTYELQKGQIRISKGEATIPSPWVTEVPLARLYGALEEGESLSSMYLQMKGLPIDDIIEDPLVACLFNGVFGAYQRQQIKKGITAKSDR